MKEMWTAVVEGLVYGFFDSRTLAEQWVSSNFPIAQHQGRYSVLEFCSV